jgi:Zn-dependent M28 family amino/carboxypeptidase
MKKLFLIFFATFLYACQDEVPVIEDKDKILEVANSIDESKVFPWIEQLTEIHLNDTPISNEGFPPAELFPSDHLTSRAAVGFISRAFQEMGYTTDTIALGSEPQVAYNIVAEHRGVLYPDEVVLLGCHVDAFYGGADDNTSAVAAMLEIARAVQNFSFARTIRFVAFDLEEFGSIGSTRYIEAGYANDVKSAVVLDLIGYSSEDSGSQKDVLGVKFPDKGNFICVVGNEKSKAYTQQVVNLSHNEQIANTVGVVTPGDGTFLFASAFMRSDHGLMWYKGIPALFFSDGANFRNSNYHQVSDLPETINQDFLIRNTRLIAATVAILAEVQP